MSEETKTTQEPVTETEIQENVIVEEVKEESEDKKENYNTLKRELSKEYGINLFDVEGIKAFKEYQESQKTEAQRKEELIESLQTEISSRDKADLDKDFVIAALEIGIPKGKIKAAEALSKLEDINGDTINEKLIDVKEKYKEVFGDINKNDIEIVIGTQKSDETDDNTPIDPALARYLATKKK